MAIETDDVRSTFFDPAAFGTTATYVTVGQKRATINGLFDNPGSDVALAGEGPRSADRLAAFMCRESDLPAGAADGDKGDTLAISGGATYRVASIKPDGLGMARLELAKS